jgi:hypothetical protein
MRKMRYFSLALIGSLLFASINRVYDVFWSPNLVLSLLEIVTLSAMGLFNTLAYGITLGVKSTRRGRNQKAAGGVNSESGGFDSSWDSLSTSLLISDVAEAPRGDGEVGAIQEKP